MDPYGSSTNVAQSPYTRINHIYLHARTAAHLLTRCAKHPLASNLGSKECSTSTHPMDLPLWCINCKKEHASNYVNCNQRRPLLGLNPMADLPKPMKRSSKNPGKKPEAKPKSTHPK